MLSRAIPAGAVSVTMQKTAEQLVVRQHERYSCQVQADVGITADSPSRVVLSRTVGNGTGVLAATVVDCSAGGMGLESPVYLPRNARLLVRLDLGDASGRDGHVEIEGTVQRATMISRAPRYYLGLAFKGKNAPSAATVDRLLKFVSSAKTADGGTGS